MAEPTSIMVETFGTEKVPSEQLTLLVREFFDLRPYGLIQMLDLLHRSTKKPQHTVTLVVNISGGKNRQAQRCAMLPV